MSYTLAAAAAAAGVNKTTVLRAIQSGRMLGTRDELGQWHVEPVELHRVFRQQYLLPLEAAELAGTKARASPANQRVADVTSDRDQWRDQAMRLALGDQREHTEQPELGRRPWWRWFAG
jgi:hypothetical protein